MLLLSADHLFFQGNQLLCHFTATNVLLFNLFDSVITHFKLAVNELEPEKGLWII
jgi:hypothetical protein